MTLESFANFQKGQVVKFNPDNHGLQDLQYKNGKNEHLALVGDIDEHARKIRVDWIHNRTSEWIKYANLKILSS